MLVSTFSGEVQPELGKLEPKRLNRALHSCPERYGQRMYWRAKDSDGIRRIDAVADTSYPCSRISSHTRLRIVVATFARSAAFLAESSDLPRRTYCATNGARVPPIHPEVVISSQHCKSLP